MFFQYFFCACFDVFSDFSSRMQVDSPIISIYNSHADPLRMIPVLFSEDIHPARVCGI